MSFPMGVLLLFLGGVFVWIASHGTNATSPWDMFKQVMDGFSGKSPDVTRPADPWDSVGQAPAPGSAAGDSGGSGASGASGSSLSHRSRPAPSSGGSSASDMDSVIRNWRATSASQAADQAADDAAIVAAQQKLRHIGNELDGTGPLAWP